MAPILLSIRQPSNKEDNMDLIKNNKVIAAILAAIIAGLTALSAGLFGGDDKAPVEEKPVEVAPVEAPATVTPAVTEPVAETVTPAEALPADAAKPADPPKN